MKNILITGALGHIGSKFINNIKKNEFNKIVIIDNLYTQRYCSLFNLNKNINFQFIEKNILDASIEKYFKDIDIVIHFAAITDATTSFNKKKIVYDVNVKGTKKIINYCKKYNCKLIFPSTTSVYGVQNGKVDEDCSSNKLKPQSPYAQSKIEIENYLLANKFNNFNFQILRLGTIFGISDGMRFHTAVNKFCYQASFNQELTVWKTAYNQKRPYLGINDAVRCIKFIIKRDLFYNNIFNVVTGNFTVKQIISYIKKDIKNIKIKYINQKIMNQLSYFVLNKKLSKTKFKFRDSISNEIKKTLHILK
tara:strand:- start:384 stop:1304 length:921 start_codon:yes stop_codon:yes gene_type:complete